MIEKRLGAAVKSLLRQQVLAAADKREDGGRDGGHAAGGDHRRLAGLDRRQPRVQGESGWASC